MPEGHEFDFGSFFRGVADVAQEIFGQAGRHPHIVILVNGVDGDEVDVETIHFDAIVDAVPIGDLRFRIKTAFGVVADEIVEKKAIGYVEVAEGYAVEASGVQDYAKIVEEHGSIEDTPGRLEMLLVTGRLRDVRLSHTWKIKRVGKSAAVLTDGKEAKLSVNVGSASVLDKAVSRSLGETTVCHPPGQCPCSSRVTYVDPECFCACHGE